MARNDMPACTLHDVDVFRGRPEVNLETTFTALGSRHALSDRSDQERCTLLKPEQIRRRKEVHVQIGHV
ncbi:MAG: hypothetical protein WC734_00820 [Patescibacteria group bacterium]